MIRKFAIPLGYTTAVLLLAASCAPAPDRAGSSDRAGTPVTDEHGGALGTVDFPSSCADAAQQHLERGLALLHHMTYLKAEVSFAEAAGADPECALAYWGQAMTYAHPLWPDTTPEARLARGAELLERARSAAHRSAREDAYVAAAQGYYDGDGTTTKSERLAAFLDGWAAAHRDHPDDPEAKLFHALALMATAPPTDKSYEKQAAAGRMAEEVLAGYPRHPGAHHYVIHAYDFPPLAPKALDVARSYDEVAPENSHALHMTSHIFTRLGLWQESITFNVRAAAAAEERTPAGEISMHKLHALDYLAYAYLQTADDDAAREVLGALEALEPPFQQHAATAYAFAAVPARLSLERQDWAAAAAIVPGRPAAVQWERFPHLLAIAEFARALGAAHAGNDALARESIRNLEALQAKAAALEMAYDWGVQVEIQKLAAEAWLAYRNGDTEMALERMKHAAELEATTEKNPVTPGEVLPARELYGDLLLATDSPGEARALYEAALGRSPNRFNSLYGAGRAAELAGDDEAAAGYYRRLLAICPSPSGAELARLRHASDYLEAGV
jgi:Tfp pilus assembly protein PilF